ncbi:hypothetical protein U0070_026255, partial [Myodes glareolus]
MVHLAPADVEKAPLQDVEKAAPLLWAVSPRLRDRMDNKSMYMHTVNDRDSGSIFEEPFDGRSLSKLNLCEDADAEYWIFGGPFCGVPAIHLNKPVSSARHSPAWISEFVVLVSSYGHRTPDRNHSQEQSGLTVGTGPCHKRKVGGCCTQLGSLSALKHAVLGLYLLVFLILVGIFILAGWSLKPADIDVSSEHTAICPVDSDAIMHRG